MGAAEEGVDGRWDVWDTRDFLHLGVVPTT